MSVNKCEDRPKTRRHTSIFERVSECWKGVDDAGKWFLGEQDSRGEAVIVIREAEVIRRGQEYDWFPAARARKQDRRIAV